MASSEAIKYLIVTHVYQHKYKTKREVGIKNQSEKEKGNQYNKTTKCNHSHAKALLPRNATELLLELQETITFLYPSAYSTKEMRSAEYFSTYSCPCLTYKLDNVISRRPIR